MSSGGPKMVERSYGVAENGRKSQEQSGDHGGGRRRRFAGFIRASPVAIGHEIWPA